MKLIPSGLTQKIGRQILTIQKHSPRTMFVGGMIGIGISTVMACRATLKLEATLEDFKAEVDEFKSDSYGKLPDGGVSSTQDRKDLAYIYGKNSAKLIRLYGPAAVVGGVSVGLLTGSHVTLTKRNAGLTAAYSALQVSYDQYIARVRDEVGADKERDIRNGVTNQTMSINGKKEIVPIADPNGMSVYSKFFDEANANWVKNPELNRLFVQCQQNYLNHLLQSRGHVFLNEAYDALGIERSTAGQVVGWVMGNGGDNYIDFGLFEVQNAAFVNGWERTILLDFNVDGVIYDKI